MWFIKLAILLSVVFIIMIYMEWDRTIKLWFSSYDTLIQQYKLKPHPTKRTVVIIECESGLCDWTLKSLLDQSVRVHAININTNHPEKIDDKVKEIATLHRPGTEILREPSADTILINLKNGIVYPYDSIETKVNQ